MNDWSQVPVERENSWNHPPILFFSEKYRALGERILRLSSFEEGQIESKLFPDGERYLRILTEVLGRDVVLLGGTLGEAETTMLYDLACGMTKSGAHTLTMVVPYFGYSTMERKVKPGEVVTAKTRARIFSSVPTASMGNRILLLDLHSEGIPHYFEGNLVAQHCYAKASVRKAARDFAGDDFVMACTDAGRAKWVESLANDLGVDAAFIFKRRISGDKVEFLAMNASVEGKDVVIYDDMIRSGGSLIQAVRAYREAGAKRVFAITTHAILPLDAAERLQNEPGLEGVAVTDSHPRAEDLDRNFFPLYSVAELLATAIRKGLP